MKSTSPGSTAPRTSCLVNSAFSGFHSIHMKVRIYAFETQVSNLRAVPVRAAGDAA